MAGCWGGEGRAPWASTGSLSAQTLFPSSPLVLHPDAVHFLTVSCAEGLLPRAGDPCWSFPPWNCIRRSSLEALTRAGFAHEPWSFSSRLSCLMALAASELARDSVRTLWVVREWMRPLGLSFLQRESVELTVRAFLRVLKAPGEPPPPWGWRVNRGDLERILAVADLALPASWSFPPVRWVQVRAGAPRLWLMVGIPASGKSTWARRCGIRPVVCMDVLREQLAGDPRDQSRNEEVFRRAMAMLRAALCRGRDVVFDATNVHPDSRREPLRIAATLGAPVTAVIFDTPFRVCVARNAARWRKVPVGALVRFAQNLLYPGPEECPHRVVVAPMTCAAPSHRGGEPRPRARAAVPPAPQEREAPPPLAGGSAGD